MSKLIKHLIIKFFFIISIVLYINLSYSNNFHDCVLYDSEVTEAFKKNWVYKHFPAEDVKKYLNWLEDKKLPYKKSFASKAFVAEALKQCVSKISGSK